MSTSASGAGGDATFSTSGPAPGGWVPKAISADAGLAESGIPARSCALGGESVSAAGPLSGAGGQVGVTVAVAVGVADDIAVGEGISVGVVLGVDVGVKVLSGVGVKVAAGDGVSVGVKVEAGEDVGVKVLSGVGVAVGDKVGVSVANGGGLKAGKLVGGKDTRTLGLNGAFGKISEIFSRTEDNAAWAVSLSANHSAISNPINPPIAPEPAPFTQAMAISRLFT